MRFLSRIYFQILLGFVNGCVAEFAVQIKSNYAIPWEELRRRRAKADQGFGGIAKSLFVSRYSVLRLDHSALNSAKPGPSLTGG